MFPLAFTSGYLCCSQRRIPSLRIQDSPKARQINLNQTRWRKPEFCFWSRGERGRRSVKTAAFSLPSLPGNGVRELWNNRIFMAGLFSATSAQLLKVFIEAIKTKKLNLRSFAMAGGMPSSHSSVCVTVTTAVAYSHGLGSALFAVSLCFTFIVMYDAAGIRRHAGDQAKILNRLTTSLRSNTPDLAEIAALKEVLGHSRREVLGGALLGVLVGIFWPV